MSDSFRMGEVEVSERDGVTVVSLPGEHDLASAPSVRTGLEQAVRSGEGVVVSLANTTFLESTLVHALYQADKKLQHTNQRLVLHLGDNAMVERMLDLSGLISALPSFKTLEEAITYTQAKNNP